jgi:hypothetical protein
MGSKDGCNCMGAVRNHFTHPECILAKSVLGRENDEIMLCYACMEWASSVEGDMMSSKTLNAGLVRTSKLLWVSIPMRAQNQPDILPKYRF